jgi:hypothetical protein
MPRFEDAITEAQTLSPSGALILLESGSTAPVAEVRRHVGIVRVKRYSFLL